jgi:uncharacterized protein (TIGR00290 family)
LSYSRHAVRLLDGPVQVMAVKEKVILSWSGGKDAALALHELQSSNQYEISALLTTITQDFDRVSMHGVRRILLERQAESLGLPLEIVLISKDTSDEEYGSKMREVLEKCLTAGVSCAAFGDIYLEDMRKYREDNLSKVGMQGVFPLWRRDTTELAHGFIDLGFEAVITCVDSEFLEGTFVGRTFDERFLSELPPDVDPCGENGEFHTFVCEGPIFQRRILYNKGEVVFRDSRFYYCDLIPV